MLGVQREGMTVSRPQRALGSDRHGLALRNGDARAGGESSDSPLVDFVRRWWAVLLVGSVLGAAGGYVYGKLGPTSYQSLALLQVRSDPGSSRPATDAQIAALGFAAQAVAPQVLDHVSQALRQDGTYILSADLQAMTQTNRLTVQPVKGSSALTITATYDDPAVAQSLADNLAAAVVDDAATQARAESDNRHKELQDNIDRTHGVLSSAQLYQHEQDLQQRLQTQQALLLQLQSSYQQSLQQQVQVALLLRPQPTPTEVPAPNPDQQRQLNSLSATSAQALTAELAMLKGQQDVAQQTIDELDGQLASVRGQLSGLPDPTGATATPVPRTQPLDPTGKIADLQQQQTQLRDQLGQQTQLEKQEHDVQVQSNDLHNQLRTLQTQSQQAVLTQQTSDQQRQQQQQQATDALQRERDHLGLLKATLDTIVPLKGQTALNDAQLIQLQSVNAQIADSKSKTEGLNAQLQQLQQSASTSVTTTATVALLQKQLQDTQQASKVADAQLADAQSRRAALQKTLGPNPNGTLQTLSDQIAQLQQQQRDQDQSDKQAQTLWTTLKQQEQDLLRQRESARSQLLQAQREQQQDIQRQTDLSQRDIQTQVAQTPRQTAASSGPAGPDLMNTSTDLRDGLQSQLQQQQQQVTASIADVTAQLDLVHSQQAALPDKMDPAQAAVQSNVAAQRLALLTQEYTRLLVAEANGVGPLERFGPAAPATPIASQNRMLPVGVAGGLGLAAVLALLMQLVLNARRNRSTPPPTVNGNGNGAAPSGNRYLVRRQGHLASQD
jgi:hypothetical protein